MIATSFQHLAQIYLEQDGIGEATILQHFKYRKGRGIEDVTTMLARAEQELKGLGKGTAAAAVVSRYLRRVLVKRPPNAD